MKFISGKEASPEARQAAALIRFRPAKLDQHGQTLIVENLRIDDVLNQSAIDIGVSAPHLKAENGQICTYKSVVVRNCEISNVRRDETGRQSSLNIDFIRVTGAGDEQPYDTELLVEDCYLRGGDALPLVIRDGRFSTITFRRIRFEDTGLQRAQLVFTQSGHARSVVIEESPGLQVELLGRPGAVEKCIIRSSRGAEMIDSPTAAGRTGARLIDEDMARPIVPVTAGIEAREPTPHPRSTPTSKNATKPSPPRLIVERAGDDKVRVRVENVAEGKLAFILFEAFNANAPDYRFGSPVVVTTTPWEALLPAPKGARVKIVATPTRLGGDPDAPLSTTLDLPRPK